MSQLPILVISLARIPERRASIVEHLASLGLSCVIIEGVDGKLLSEEELDRLRAPEFRDPPGVVGCYLSHIRAYEHIVANNLPAALILEDDARISPAIAPALREGAISFDADYCFLDCDGVRAGTQIYYDPDTAQELAKGFTVYEPSLAPTAAHAYIITLKAARMRAENAFPIREPADWYDTLPYEARFLVCVKPKGASVSAFSFQSQTSARHLPLTISRLWLKRSPLYQTLRDWLKLRPIRALLEKRRLVRSGALPPARRWRAMPLGREVFTD